MNLLVTGGAGFIGSNFVRAALARYADGRVVVLDALTYAGNLDNLKGLDADSRYTFVRGDIRDRALAGELFTRYQLDTVVHFAAESHVDRSIEQPDLFLSANVLGTDALLSSARKAWNLCPEDKYSRAYREGVRFLYVSTDEVYGSLGSEGRFRETDPLAPNSPYAASKAGGELLVRAYRETYGLPVNITRCSNNYGPYQFPEKLIPLVIHNALNGIPLPVYGDGLQIRDWLYVEDHCSAICTVLERGRPGEIYNIGGGSERTNLEIIRAVTDALGRGGDLITFVRDRPGHDRRYALDHTRLTSELGWNPAWTFEDGIARTVAWYLNHQDWMRNVTSGAYRTYYARMYGGLGVEQKGGRS